jgi:hypothetical protein
VKRKLTLVTAAALVAAASLVGATATAAAGTEGPRAINLPPRVALTSPIDGGGGVIGCPIMFAATAGDVDDQILSGKQMPGDIPVIADDGIDRVEFYLNDRLLATDDFPPYEVTVVHGPFIPATDGENTAFARAYDNDTPQLTTDSATVAFLMAAPPPTLPGEPDDCMKGTAPATPPSS